MTMKIMTVREVLKIIKEMERHKSLRQTIIRNNNWTSDLDLHIDAINQMNSQIKELNRLINNAKIKVPRGMLNEKKNRKKR